MGPTGWRGAVMGCLRLDMESKTSWPSECLPNSEFHHSKDFYFFPRVPILSALAFDLYKLYLIWQQGIWGLPWDSRAGECLFVFSRAENVIVVPSGQFFHSTGCGVAGLIQWPVKTRNKAKVVEEFCCRLGCGEEKELFLLSFAQLGSYMVFNWPNGCHSVLLHAFLSA